MADSVMVRVKAGCVDQVVMAAVMPDSVISRPLLGRNLGLVQCAVQARDLQRKPPQVTAQTRAITAKEAKEEQQAVMIREAEQAVIIKLEELQPAILDLW